MMFIKRITAVFLLMILLMNACAFAEGDAAVQEENEENIEDELLEMIIEENETDDEVSADLPIPVSNGNDIYLVIGRDGEDSENITYVHFEIPDGTILDKNEESNALAVDLINFGVYTYYSGESAVERLADMNELGSEMIRDGGDGVTAWLNPDGVSADAIITLPEAGEGSWLLLETYSEPLEPDDDSNKEWLKYLLDNEIERLLAGIEIINAYSPAEIELEEEIALRGISVKSVKLNNSSLSIYKGKTATLKATISPSNASNKKISWSTSNKKVATVNGSGVVTATGTGTATITAKSNNGKTAACKVTVKERPAVSSVVFKGIIASVPIVMRGKPVSLVAVCLPSEAEQTVTWSTSNKNVATVSSKGEVKPTGYGTCKITAKSKNGKTATCTVVVNDSVEISKTIVACQVSSISSSVKNKLGTNIYNIVRSNFEKISKTVLGEDRISIFIDGKTGKVKKTWSKQIPHSIDVGVFSIKVEGKGIEVINQKDNYVEFRSVLIISIGSKTSKYKINASVINVICDYKLYNTGKLEVYRY